MAVRAVSESERIGAAVKTLLNIIWLVLAGIWLALGYVFAAVLLVTGRLIGATRGRRPGTATGLDSTWRTSTCCTSG